MIKRREKSEAEVSVGAFPDIAFLLIIFFILTTSFIQNKGTRLDIPAGENKQGETKKETPTILLSEKDIKYNKKSITPRALRETLKAENFPKKAESDRVVILECQGDVKYQRYFSIVTIINNSGAVMALMTQEKGDGKNAKSKNDAKNNSDGAAK